jgi:hypothetical protein
MPEHTESEISYSRAVYIWYRAVRERKEFIGAWLGGDSCALFKLGYQRTQFSDTPPAISGWPSCKNEAPLSPRGFWVDDFVRIGPREQLNALMKGIDARYRIIALREVR